MKHYESDTGGRGFSLVELVAVVAVVVSVGAVLGPSVGSMRSQMRGVSSEGNLAAIGQVGGMYAVDSDDRIFSFTWQAGGIYTNLSNGKQFQPSSDQTAASYQVRDILYRATGRLEGESRILWSHTRLMHRRFSHLVLVDYLGGSVTDPMWVDPMDANQLSWQLHPLEYLEPDNSVPYGNGYPNKAGYDEALGWEPQNFTQLWPFASSYQVVPHAWLQDFGDQYRPVDETPHLFSATGFDVQLGERRHTEVRFPSAKVWMFEEFDREQAGSPYFAYDHAEPAKLMFDGSINTMASGLSQSSVSPVDYLNGDKFVWEQKYVPLDTFPVPLGGLGDQTLLSQRFRWTLGGLSGVNYPQALSRGR